MRYLIDSLKTIWSGLFGFFLVYLLFSGISPDSVPYGSQFWAQGNFLANTKTTLVYRWSMTRWEWHLQMQDLLNGAHREYRQIERDAQPAAHGSVHRSHSSD